MHPVLLALPSRAASANAAALHVSERTRGRGQPFVLARVANLSSQRTTMAILPWLVRLLISLALITYVPEIGLWLPRVLHSGQPKRAIENGATSRPGSRLSMSAAVVAPMIGPSV